MHWTDESIVLSLRPHGESAGILEVLTRMHGRHLGVVHGIASTRNRTALLPGNRVNLGWRARNPDQLGVLTVELALARAAIVFEQRTALIGMNSAIAVASAVLPEREPHERAYAATDALLDIIAGGEILEWGPAFVFWEIGLLNELGFGLDLSRCAVLGTIDDLIYVSPRSGRAVSREAGFAYRERLLALPRFLQPDMAAQPDTAQISAGLRLTGHFLNRWVLQPCGKSIPYARQRLEDSTVPKTEKSQV